ncbi:hypothetical protein C1646_788831 [Rhizophagus diaphanus]|nr:hypothetical protein C1646_788831 [Rhizophagus diaphanus] [Rhizophagus sp. MUCL 43196]
MSRSSMYISACPYSQIQNFNVKMRFVRNELISLKDMGFLRGKFEEEVNWKTLALNNIMLLKDKIKREKANIRNLSKDAEEIKLNTLQRVSRGSENTLVEIIACLIDMVMYYLPVNYEVEVTRAERQSKASKNCKVQQKTGSRGDKPDLMFCAYLRQKWEEIIFFKSGK